MVVNREKIIRETVEKFAMELDGNSFRKELPKAQRLHAIDRGLIVVYGTFGGKFYLDGYLNQEIDSFKDKTIWFNRENEYKGKEGYDQYGNTPQNRCSNLLTIRITHALYNVDLAFACDVPNIPFRIMKNNKVYCVGLVMHVDDLK